MEENVFWFIFIKERKKDRWIKVPLDSWCHIPSFLFLPRARENIWVSEANYRNSYPLFSQELSFLRLGWKRERSLRADWVSFDSCPWPNSKANSDWSQDKVDLSNWEKEKKERSDKPNQRDNGTKRHLDFLSQAIEPKTSCWGTWKTKYLETWVSECFLCRATWNVSLFCVSIWSALC